MVVLAEVKSNFKMLSDGDRLAQPLQMESDLAVLIYSHLGFYAS